MRCVDVHGRLVEQGVEWTATLSDGGCTQVTTWILPAGSPCPVELGAEYTAHLAIVRPPPPATPWPPPPPPLEDS